MVRLNMVNITLLTIALFSATSGLSGSIYYFYSQATNVVSWDIASRYAMLEDFTCYGGGLKDYQITNVGGRYYLEYQTSYVSSGNMIIPGLLVRLPPPINPYHSITAQNMESVFEDLYEKTYYKCVVYNNKFLGLDVMDDVRWAYRQYIITGLLMLVLFFVLWCAIALSVVYQFQSKKLKEPEPTDKAVKLYDLATTSD